MTSKKAKLDYSSQGKSKGSLHPSIRRGLPFNSHRGGDRMAPFNLDRSVIKAIVPTPAGRSLFYLGVKILPVNMLTKRSGICIIVNKETGQTPTPPPIANRENMVIKRFLSLGGGVQSFTLALLIKEGVVPAIDAAIFADTQWEPYWVAEQIEWLKKEVPFPVFTVTKGNLREDLINSYENGSRFASIPAFTPHGIGRRQCTNEYKIVPINRKKRELLGLKKGEKSKGLMCETLIGISLDECGRMRDSFEKWSKNTYPLVDLQMTRQDCVDWLKQKKFPVPRKSSCIGCPFHSDDEWKAIKSDPKLWADACEIDELIRDGSIRSLKPPQYLHPTRIPLSCVDLSTQEERGQLSLFENECYGMCGV